jgi:hypothetical protein
MRSGAVDSRKQPIANYHPNPQLALGTSFISAANAATITRLADTRLGSPYCEKVELPSGGVADSGINLTAGLTPAAIGFPIGRAFSFSFDLITLTSGGLPLRFSRQGGAISGSPINQAFTAVESTTAVPIPRYSFDCTTATLNSFSLYVLRNAAGQLGTFYVGNFMIGPPGYTGPFRAGDSAGWKWRGTAGASISQGWPA